jgi:ribosome-associated translation inhibitor RaiA
MKHVRVRLTAGGREADVHPMYDLWTNAPFVERASALQWNFTGDALGILHYAVGDADAFEAAVREVPEVLDYDLVRAGDDAFYAYIRDATTDELADLFGPVTRGGLVVVPPIRYHEDGTVSFSLFGPDAEIQAAVEAVPAPVTVTVERVGGLEAVAAAAETSLTERQREAVEAAVELGYYEIPREAGHEDVAAALDCAPSTAAEHLRKAESKLVCSVVRAEL